VLYKRLDAGRFRIPEAIEPDATSVEIDERELDDLLDGIDIEVASRSYARGSRLRH
jgi:hypothetical protein